MNNTKRSHLIVSVAFSARRVLINLQSTDIDIYSIVSVVLPAPHHYSRLHLYRSRSILPTN